MKIIYEGSGKWAQLVNEEKKIFGTDRDEYFDENGERIPREEIVFDPDEDDEEEAIWDSDWLEYEGTSEKLISESTVEIEWEIDDGFGTFGFKNRAGEFVIEPQYAYAHQFTCGLAAVNLNRTWYKTEKGDRYYENHYGYINERGETVIPFEYDEAYPFNKYGVAVAETRNEIRLIDTAGKVVPGTEGLRFSHYYDYEDRFITFYSDDESDGSNDIGLYDTKERRVLCGPSFSCVIQWEEDLIGVYEEIDTNLGYEKREEYYINSKGEKLFPWLIGKDFSVVERPNEDLLTVVAYARFEEAPKNATGAVLGKDGKLFWRDYRYGVYSKKEKFAIPPEYDSIKELAKNVFACVKDDTVTVFRAEESDIER